MKINATLHCHGPWTDYQSGRFDIETFPRSLDRIADLAISRGLDLVGLTDIAGCRVCKVYAPLMDKTPKRYTKEHLSPTCTKLTRKADDRVVYFSRSLEILSNESHVLAVGTSADILGARPLLEVAQEIKETGGVAIADHPCYTIKLGKGMGSEMARMLKERGLLSAIEVNANIVPLLEDLFRSNELARGLARDLNLPLIGNCDANAARDVGTIQTTYNIEDVENPETGVISLIKEAPFNDPSIKIRGNVKPFFSLPFHVIRGFYSILRGRLGLIKEPLPTC